MSVPDLPADPNDWPDNPYEILGLPGSVAPQDVRRAYVRLIRKYKPEQFPEEFRRIREAYEQVSRWQSWMEQEDARPTEEEQAQPPEPVAMPRPVPGSDLDKLWERALQGELQAAYDGTLRAHRERPDLSDPLIRLYWLLLVQPELDAQRHRLDWLTQALALDRLQGSARELYRRELLDHPDEALQPRCTALLGINTQAYLRAQFATWRWHAATHFPDWDALLREDLTRLRESIQREDELTWTQLLFSAVDLLAWAPPWSSQQLFEACRRELEGLQHLHDQLEHAFDRFDFLLELREGYRQAQGQGQTASDFLQLISLSWRRPFEEYRMDLEHYLARIVADPHNFLSRFSDQAHLPRVLLSQFNVILNHLEYSGGRTPSYRTDEHVARAVQELLYRGDWQDYATFRVFLLDTCIHEAITAEQAAEALAQVPNLIVKEHEAFKQRLETDWPLYLVARACFLFWT